MDNFESILKGFKGGQIEKIFISIYSYFVLGYLILFTTYGQNFIVLQFSTQVLLSIGISFPLTTLCILVMGKKRTDKDKDLGLFYHHAVELILTSILLSSLFSLAYIITKLNSSWALNPLWALVIILLCFLACYLEGKRVRSLDKQ